MSISCGVEPALSSSAVQAPAVVDVAPVPDAAAADCAAAALDCPPTSCRKAVTVADCGGEVRAAPGGPCCQVSNAEGGGERQANCSNCCCVRL